jgi:hypothetical protein
VYCQFRGRYVILRTWFIRGLLSREFCSQRYFTNFSPASIMHYPLRKVGHPKTEGGFFVAWPFAQVENTSAECHSLNATSLYGWRREFLARSQNCEKRLFASSYLSFLPSVRTEQLGSQLAEFHEICYLSIFRKYAYRIQPSLKSDKNDGYFTWRILYIYGNISFSSS